MPVPGHAAEDLDTHPATYIARPKRQHGVHTQRTKHCLCFCGSRELQTRMCPRPRCLGAIREVVAHLSHITLRLLSSADEKARLRNAGRVPLQPLKLFADQLQAILEVVVHLCRDGHKVHWPHVEAVPQALCVAWHCKPHAAAHLTEFMSYAKSPTWMMASYMPRCVSSCSRDRETAFSLPRSPYTARVGLQECSSGGVLNPIMPDQPRMKGRGKREIPKKSSRPTASSGMIPTSENPNNDDDEGRRRGEEEKLLLSQKVQCSIPVNMVEHTSSQRDNQQTTDTYHYFIICYLVSKLLPPPPYSIGPQPPNYHSQRIIGFTSHPILKPLTLSPPFTHYYH
ncbi:hypothetical protein PR048_030140 [Dryococelus australis]|uniref:Uncharacterized protein n=1 Tax=Dryococelus australis TaxID=614101 RepID=A0ABQ9GAU3_9NEOP|nr:hypothetical protein PR048_030140 [Dryococelus australis]